MRELGFHCHSLTLSVLSRVQDTAEKFVRDARLKVDVDLASIADRMAIRSAVCSCVGAPLCRMYSLT
jgi:hypothetical protein